MAFVQPSSVAMGTEPPFPWGGVDTSSGKRIPDMWKELGQKSAKISYKDVFKAPSFVDTSSVWNAPSVTETKTDYSASTPALDPAHAQNVLAETELIKNLQPLYLDPSFAF